MKIIESPREAMQGLDYIIPASTKVRYINSLLNAGFDTIETGSIVSPSLIPQMADSLEVLKNIDIRKSASRLMMLTVSRKGIDIVADLDKISYISYPFSFSGSFLRKNMNTTTDEAYKTVSYLAEKCAVSGKIPVVYISMAFGNPFQDEWNIDLLIAWIEKLKQSGISIIPLSNVSVEISPGLISDVFTSIIPAFSGIEFGLHLHTTNQDWYNQIAAAYNAGCRRFDTVMGGLGGCPFAGDKLLGNLSTQNMASFIEKNNIQTTINQASLKNAIHSAMQTFIEPAGEEVNNE